MVAYAHFLIYQLDKPLLSKEKIVEERMPGSSLSTLRRRQTFLTIGYAWLECPLGVISNAPLTLGDPV
jgi:hypothetical protein